MYSTYLGGDNEDTVLGIAVDSANNAYLTGSTVSSNFPTTVGAYDVTKNRSRDIFVTKINSTATAIVYSTYYGGNDQDYASAITLDSANCVHVIGTTTSDDLSISADGPSTNNKGTFDTFVARFSADGKALTFATYLGGVSAELGYDIAVDASGATYVVGTTYSDNYPYRTGPLYRSRAVYDAFITKLMYLNQPTFTKQFGAPTIPVGGKTDLTFSISNPNEEVMLNLNFVDHLPSGLVVANPANVSNSCGGAIFALEGSSRIELTEGALAGTTQCSISVDVEGTTPGLKQNTTEPIKAFDNLVGNKATAHLSVASPPLIVKAFGATTIPMTDPDPNKNVTDLVLNIGNPNPTVTLTGVGFTDNLPAGLVVATPNGLSNTCSGAVSAVANSSLVSLAGGVLAPLGTCQVVVKVRGTTAGYKVNMVNVTSAEGGSGSSTMSTLTVVAPPHVMAGFSPSEVIMGNISRLTITITNENKGETLTGVGLIDNLPAGMIADSFPPIAGPSCGPGTDVKILHKNQIVLSNATVRSGDPCQVTVRVRGTRVGSITNTTEPVTSGNGGWGNKSTSTLNVKSSTGIVIGSNQRE